MNGQRLCEVRLLAKVLHIWRISDKALDLQLVRSLRVNILPSHLEILRQSWDSPARMSHWWDHSFLENHDWLNKTSNAAASFEVADVRFKGPA